METESSRGDADDFREHNVKHAVNVYKHFDDISTAQADSQY